MQSQALQHIAQVEIGISLPIIITRLAIPFNALIQKYGRRIELIKVFVDYRQISVDARLLKWIIRNPILVIVIVLSTSLFFAVQLPKLSLAD